MECVTLLSGGLDSVTMAYFLREQGMTQHFLFVDYGQKHLKEWESAEGVARDFKSALQRVHISSSIFKSALTGQGDIPKGKYAPDNLAITVVPNRNAIFACLAASYATSLGIKEIALAVHAGDHEGYADCRPPFISALQAMLMCSLNTDFQVNAPFVRKQKWEIVKLGHLLRVPFMRTWSCYEGGLVHCGKCATCLERREAFQIACISDPIRYLGEP